MELVTACRGEILMLGDHPCSLAVCVGLDLSLPGKATGLEAPEENRKQISWSGFLAENKRCVSGIFPLLSHIQFGITNPFVR